MSDMKHDFGGYFTKTEYNTRNTLFPNAKIDSKAENDGIKPLSEDEILSGLGINPTAAGGAGGAGVGKYKSNVPNADTRLSTRCRFKLQQKSDIYSTEYVSFNPFGKGNNANIGIIQDCGPALFGLMGSKNLITFGSVLDQAGKPTSKEDNPRAYIPASGVSLTFRACVLGFDNEYVGNITISNFRGRTVTCTFETKGAGAGAKRTDARISKNSDYFLSVPDVKAMIEIRNSEAPSFLIGKALGDALQTVSAIKVIPTGIFNPLNPGVLNPYYPIGQNLSDISGTSSKETNERIDNIIINTCDRLEYARNFAAGISSTLTSGGQNGSDVVFDYIVGTGTGKITPEIIYTDYLNRFKVLVSTVDDAWEKLIQTIKKKYTNDRGYQQYMVNSTASDGLELITTDDQKTRTIKCLKGLVIVLETFRFCVLTHFLTIYQGIINSRVITAEIAANAVAQFETAASVMHGLVPSSSDTLNRFNRNSVLIHIFKGIKNDQIVLPVELKYDDVSNINRLLKTDFRAGREVDIPQTLFPIQVAGSMVADTDAVAAHSTLKGSYSFYTQDI